jgi:hypothetical protein
MYAARGFSERFDVDVRSMIPEAKRDHLCPTEFAKQRVFNYCKRTQPAPPAAIFLGDSRTQGIYDGVASVLGRQYPLALLARGGCPAVLGVNLHYVAQGGCVEAWNMFVRYVQEVKPRLVIIAGGGADLLNTKATTLDEIDHFGSRKEAFKFGLRKLVQALQVDSRVVYIRQVPKFKSSPNCFLRPITLPGQNCSPQVPRSAMEQRMAAYNDIVDEVQREFPALRVLDPADALCSAERCSQQLTSGEILYSDQIHLSTAGGRYFAQTSGLIALIQDELASER